MNIPFTPAELDALFDRATPVKVGKIREVRRINDMYLKLDHRLNGSFKKEFNCAKKLKDCGIPVTEPLFYLRSGRGNYLVTRAFDGVAVDEYLKHHHESKAFFEKAAKLLCRMLDANFIHRDFHLGNLLYSPSGKNFVLVDVDSVQKIPAFLKRFIPEDVKFDLLTEFRGFLRKKELLEIFTVSGVKKPEDFYTRIFVNNSAYVRHSWAKRREQILLGYPKFTTVFDAELFTADADESEFVSAEEMNSGRGIFLANFYLDLLKVPHRRALRFNPADGKVLLAAENPRPAPADAAAEMIERLQFYGIKTVESDWRQGSGELPELNALEKVAILPFIM